MQHRVEMWKTLRRLLTVVAIIGGIYLLVVAPLERALGGMKRTLEDGLEAILGAGSKREVKVVEGRAEVVQQTEISELSLLEMRMSATRTIEKAESSFGLPLGTKRLIVRGHYRVKAGYRLKPGISLGMDGKTLVVRFPKAEVLSVELIDYDVLSEDEGWLNRIQPEDRAQILRELRAQMTGEAQASGMLETVDSTLRTRLRDLMGAKEVRMEKMP
ncbi:MAG: DUF4230 domain-containing protein [Luteolibacter sp.]